MVTAIEREPLSSLREWIVKRGILYALTQTPMLALMIGYFFRWTTVPIATVFTVVLAFAVLPVWVLYRREVSDDPTEPAHHLRRYALYALVPYVVYNLARVPMHYLLNIVFWDHWYDFGAELTGEPVDQWSSLIPGTFIHSLQGYVLALGFYILYRRHSLLNALAYVFVFLSVIYTWTFPSYVLVDYQPPPKWFFVVWWAHFWMALAAWYVPKLYGRGLFSRFQTRLSRGIAALVLVLLYFVPVMFVFWRVATWQFPLQHTIDEATFERAQLVMKRGPALVQVEEGTGLQEARYEFTLEFGSRVYTDYINAQKALDAELVAIDGRLIHNNRIIAWCNAYVQALETPNTILNPLEYFPALQAMEYTEVPVSCIGPPDLARELVDTAEDRTIDLHWTGTAMLRGDREFLIRDFGETLTAVDLALGHGLIAVAGSGN